MKLLISEKPGLAGYRPCCIGGCYEKGVAHFAIDGWKAGRHYLCEQHLKEFKIAIVASAMRGFEE